jgi:hypothetical protein
MLVIESELYVYQLSKGDFSVDDSRARKNNPYYCIGKKNEIASS